MIKASGVSEPAETIDESMSMSAAIHLSPMGWPERPASGVDLELFAQQMTSYLAHNLSKFADPRGADVFVSVIVQRGDESAGHEFRSGHYVKSESSEGVRGE